MNYCNTKDTTMKKIIITSLLFLAGISSLWSQNQESNGALRQQLEAMKVAFITEKIGLTPEQAQNFWPLYNAYQTEQKAVRKKYRPGKRLELMSDSELKTYLLNTLEQEETLLALKRQFFEDAQASISVRQIALLRKAEQEFNKEVLRKMVDRQRNAQRKPGNQ